MLDESRGEGLSEVFSRRLLPVESGKNKERRRLQSGAKEDASMILGAEKSHDLCKNSPGFDIRIVHFHHVFLHSKSLWCM